MAQFYETRNKQRSDYYKNLQERLAEKRANAAKEAALYARYQKADDSVETIDEVVEKVIEEKTSIIQ